MVRGLSAAVLVALLIVIIWFLPPWATVIGAALAAAIAGAELAALARQVGIDVHAYWTAETATLGALAFALAGTTIAADYLLALTVLAIAIGGFATTLATTAPGVNALGRSAMVILSMAYVGAPLGTLAWVRMMSGPGPLTWLIAVIALSDSAQYYTGRTLGRRKLAPVVSPGKTIEGAVGGAVIAAVAGGLLARYWLPAMPATTAALLALALAAFGMTGDLFKSLLKRSAGVKDSGTLIPGHGGVLDRVDAYLFAGPIFYVYLRFVA
jgi:phosphatidate cytidylyltransferase